jgi:phosphoglycerate dehydrogenase-like enzyme
MDEKLKVGLACNAHYRERGIKEHEITRLEEFATFEWRKFEEMSDWYSPPVSSREVVADFIDFASSKDAMIVCHGSPRVTPEILDAAPNLGLIGELEGDRFAQRIDVAACVDRGVKAVDTTHASSLPVSEWALAMMMMGLKKVGAHYRRLITDQNWGTPEQRATEPDFQMMGDLTGRTVGLIGGGNIARRLIELLVPFRVEILLHDPYLPRELASALSFTMTSLKNVMSMPDVVVCLVPHTPATEGMLGTNELNWIRPGAVFVNVSRGQVVQSDALIERLQKNDIYACLDVFDPEPVPTASPIRSLWNVFLTPHIASTTDATGISFFGEMIDELKRFHLGHDTKHDLMVRTLANRRGEPPNDLDAIR